MNTTGIFFRFPFIPYFCQLCIPWHDSYPYDMCLLIRYGSNIKGFRKVSNQVAAAVAWFNFVAKEMQKSKNLYIITLFPDMHQLFLYVWYIYIYIYMTCILHSSLFHTLVCMLCILWHFDEFHVLLQGKNNDICRALLKLWNSWQAK